MRDIWMIRFIMNVMMYTEWCLPVLEYPKKENVQSLFLVNESGSLGPGDKVDNECRQ